MKITVKRDYPADKIGPGDSVTLTVQGAGGNANQSVRHLAVAVVLNLAAARRLARQLAALTRR